MYNITHNNTAVSAEELGIVAADGRTRVNHNFKFRAMGAVTAQLHGSFVARTIPECNRLPAAAADAVSPALFQSRLNAIGLYRDVWIAAIASSRKSLATRTAAICVRFQGRRVRHVYVTMQITFLTRKSALIYRRVLRQRVASLTLDCNGVLAIKAYTGQLLAV